MDSLRHLQSLRLFSNWQRLQPIAIIKTYMQAICWSGQPHLHATVMATSLMMTVTRTRSHIMLDADQCKIKPDLGFSPNGDGQRNEIWQIQFIEDFPSNTVKVFNRWRNVVYETKGYNNRNNAWGGDSNGKLIIGDLKVPYPASLPTGNPSNHSTV